jgi:hypothetical protein
MRLSLAGVISTWAYLHSSLMLSRSTVTAPLAKPREARAPVDRGVGRVVVVEDLVAA